LKKQVLNIITQILAYDGANGVSDQPLMKAFDWTRRMSSLPLTNAQSDSFVLAAGESRALFSGAKANPLDNTSVLSITPLSQGNYRLSVTAGTSGFRTPRTVNVTTCQVTVNNNALAVFDFGAGTVTGVIAGDTMRINSQIMGDTGPFTFNPLNAGLWTVVGTNGTKISCTRPIGSGFQGSNETISAVNNNVQIYSSSGITKSDKMKITGGFSTVSQKTFEIKEVTPTTIDFISTAALPSESLISNTTNMIQFFSTSKRYFYLECDQETVVLLNGTDSTKVVPVQAGNSLLPGFLHQTGDIYSCSVTNQSINTLNIRIFTGE
jgi:hypothetical protein